MLPQILTCSARQRAAVLDRDDANSKSDATAEVRLLTGSNASNYLHWMNRRDDLLEGPGLAADQFGLDEESWRCVSTPLTQQGLARL